MPTVRSRNIAAAGWLLLVMPVHAQEPRELLQRAQDAVVRGESSRAVELATQAIEKSDKLAEAYYLRGRERFRLNRIQASLDDFDRYVRLRPAAESRQWERGIAYYYADQFVRGAKQFELYQTFHDNDVENSVWRYLCMAREGGVHKAREAMLPIKADRRIPMMQIYELYRGTLTPEAVLAAARRGDPQPSVLAGRLFYAHLYLGLYFEAQGDKKRALQYITMAADDKNASAPINRYMWDVARIHLKKLQARTSKTSE